MGLLHMADTADLVQRLKDRGLIGSSTVEAALSRVDPGAFVAEGYEFLACEDVPVPYDEEADPPGLLPSRRWTAVVLQLLGPEPGGRVLLEGSDGGYLAALLAEGWDAQVTVMEASPRRARRTAENLDRAGHAAAVRVVSRAPCGTWSRIFRRGPPGEHGWEACLEDGGVLVYVRDEAGNREVVKLLLQGDEVAEIAFREASVRPPEEGAKGSVNLGGILALEDLLSRVWQEDVPTGRDRYFLEIVESTFEGGPWDEGPLSEAEQERVRLAKRVFRLAHIHQMVGDYATAARLFRRSLEAYPTAEAHTFLGWTYSHVGRIDDAIQECRRAIEVDPSIGNPYNDIGAYLIELGRLDEAIPWLQRATRARRYCCYFYAHCNLGRVYLLKGELAAAREAFQQALEENPAYELARHLLEEVERRLG